MYRGAYAEVAASDQIGARRREYDAFDRVVSLLRGAAHTDAGPGQLARALDALESLWAVLLEDLSGRDNALQDDLRAQLISIGLWVTQKSLSIRIAGRGELASLIEINSTIRDGLRA